MSSGVEKRPSGMVDRNLARISAVSWPMKVASSGVSPATGLSALTRTPKGASSTAMERVAVSEEDAVTGVLEKVRTGEADAGLVYRTDVIAAGDSVRGIAFPESAQAINRNVIVALSAGPQAALGQEFVDLVLSEEGQKVLNAAGFGAAG